MTLRESGWSRYKENDADNITKFFHVAISPISQVENTEFGIVIRKNNANGSSTWPEGSGEIKGFLVRETARV